MTRHDRRAAEVLLSALVAAAAPAVAGDTCAARGLKVWDGWVAALSAANPGLRGYPLHGTERARMLAACGCAEWGADCPPDTVGVFYTMGNTAVIVGFGKDGCVTRVYEIGVPRFREILAGAVAC